MPVPCALFFGVALLGCSPAFAPESRLTKLRVLAIRAEPVNPQPGQVTTFDALVYAPPDHADQPITRTWSWCPALGSASDGYRCSFDEAQWQQLASSLGLTDVPPLVLGQQPTQAFRNPFPVEVAARLCEQGFDATPPDCDGGLPVRVTVVVTQGDAAITATALLRLPIADGDPGNINPSFEAGAPPLAAMEASVEIPIDDAAAATLPRLRETELRAHVADAEAESYAGVDDDGQPASLRERLVLTWFAETGDLLPDFHTGYFPGQTDLEAFVANKWKPGSIAAYSSDRARLIVVLRDNRGGVAWAEGAVSLDPAP